jgi:hypothetical protein
MAAQGREALGLHRELVRVLDELGQGGLGLEDGESAVGALASRLRGQAVLPALLVQQGAIVVGEICLKDELSFARCPEIFQPLLQLQLLRLVHRPRVWISPSASPSSPPHHRFHKCRRPPPPPHSSAMLLLLHAFSASEQQPGILATFNANV